MTEDFVTGPHRVDRPHPDLADGLAALWGRAAVAGGAVGFGPSDPVEVLRAASAQVLDDVEHRLAHLITLGRSHVLVGAAVVVPGERPAARHTGELTLLLIDPELRGQGWEQQLHDAVLAQAQALGLEKLLAAANGDDERERFYAANGWVERGRWPGAVRVPAAGDRDQVWLTRDL